MRIILITSFLILSNISFAQCKSKITKFLNSCVYATYNEPVKNFKFLFKKGIDDIELETYQEIINQKIDSINVTSKFEIYKYDDIDFEGKFKAKHIIVPKYNRVYIVKYLNKSGEDSYWYFSMVKNRIAGIHIILKGKRPFAWI